MNIIALALLGAVFFGILYRGIGDDTGQPDELHRTDSDAPKPCERTGCHLLGYFHDTHVDGRRMWTCAGCHDDGHRAGWLVTT